jgi:hypothetical protein
MRTGVDSRNYRSASGQGGMAFLILINKPMGFSQSLSGVLKVVIY